MKKCLCTNTSAQAELGDLVSFLKAISEENRLRILCILSKGELCVCEIQEELDLAQNLVSHHLKVLRDFGLIESRREGTNIHYSLNKKNKDKYIKLLAQFI